MKRDVVAPMRKAKIPIPAARLVDELKSCRSGEFKFKKTRASHVCDGGLLLDRNGSAVRKFGAAPI